jgi:hypothetical protein
VVGFINVNSHRFFARQSYFILVFIRHTREFFKGYFKGIKDYWWNRGLVEGYSGIPPSMSNKNYTDGYKSEAAGFEENAD